MASRDWNALDNFSPPTKRHYCAYLQILDFEEKSQLYFSGHFNLGAKINRAYEKALLAADKACAPPAALNISTRFFTNNIVITAAIGDTSDRALPGILLFCALLEKYLQQEDLLVHGTLSSGTFAERHARAHSFLSSVALENAYLLSLGMAQAPGIFLDPSLYGRLDASSEAFVIHQDNGLRVDTARLCRLINERDGENLTSNSRAENHGAPATDNFQRPSKRHYCAFLDILGYKEKSRKFFAGEFNLSGRTNRAYDHAFDLLQSVSRYFDTSRIKTQFFSDSIIITAEHREGSDDELFGIVQFCASLATFLSYEDLLVRGGISSGLYAEHIIAGQRFISSKALEQAHQLESTVAKNPRIVIDRSLYDELSGEGKKYIVSENDQLMIHYVKNFIPNNPDQTSVYKEMIDIFNSREKETDARARAKYTWLLDYYYWTVAQVPRINLAKYQQFRSDQQRDFSFIIPSR